MADGDPVTARCGCAAAATHQPLYRRDDGTHFFGEPRCEVHAEPLGPPPHALGVVIVDNMPIRAVSR